MIDLFDLYQSFLSYVNTFAGGWFRPQTDFEKACNDISNELWDMYTPLAEKDQAAKDKLVYFLTSKNVIVTSGSTFYGTVTPPPDYGRYASARIIVHKGDKCVPCADVDGGKCCNGEFKTQEEITDEYFDNIQEVKVENISNLRWGSVGGHKTKKPTLEKPKITQVDGVFKVAPRKVSVLVLDYYVRPRPAVFAYTVVPGNPQTGAGGQIVYNRNNSLPLQWPTTVVNDFLVRLGARFGLFTKDQFVTQAAQSERQLQNAGQ